MRSFDQAFTNWLSESLQVTVLEPLDLQIAFDDRDLVRREVLAGRDLPSDERTALTSADEQFSAQAAFVLSIFDWAGDSWFGDLSADHYARAFASAHRTQE